MNHLGNRRLQTKYKHKKEEFPESLFSLSLKCVAHNLHFICRATSSGYQLNEGIKLPSYISNPFFEIYQNGEQISDYFVSLFKDVTRTNLTSVNINNSKITDDGLLCLLHDNLYDLTLTNCHGLSSKTYINISKHAVKLQLLNIDHSVPINPFEMLKNGLIPRNNFCPPTSNLKHFVLRSIEKFLSCILKNLLNLRVLDLSYCLDLGSFKLNHINQLPYLHTLILFNVDRLPHFIETAHDICTQESLIVLDISQTDQRQGVYKDGNKTLALIVKYFPNLMYLDISGTNLAGKGIAEYSQLYESLSSKKSDILGLESRVDNPLEFLGLYHTTHNACKRHDIPAKSISGDANEIQLFNAAVSCMNKPKQLKNILDDFTYLLKNNRCMQTIQTLDIVLEALTKYVNNRLIQVSGNFTLYYILKSPPFVLTNVTAKRILTTTLTGIEFHKYDGEILFNGCHVICHLRVEDVKIINIITKGLFLRTWNDTYKKAWIILWNATDKASVCKRFLDEFYMDYYKEFFSYFTNQYDLMVHMLGVLGNVAEVKNLRPRLIQRKIIKVLSDQLFSTQEGIEVSYNAARIIAYLASDDNTVWRIKGPIRCQVLKKMTEAMLNWNLDAQLQLDYRSFKSILQLAKVRHTVECVHWAVWALANFTKVCPEKCCSIVIAEGGIRIMHELLEDDQINENMAINSLAKTVINQCMIFMESTEEASQIDK
ncbi:Armadillo-type fold,Leucine-rich repeat domain, L domain-like,Armadillo-like helical [Cinara cedri]|uniref:Armadillo-type fold,Leucine-rich repeat domain, L domain-like,Armadillo-like helical n=1 Tax=Cinara cedri TaxID=506608 RepID=A0A5E4LX39_9HEMI|nr:Armadillo-type fold,Leucine-rich repeat domain, L domain-like,Armadillo-like helical [Cinara cedri]